MCRCLIALRALARDVCRSGACRTRLAQDHMSIQHRHCQRHHFYLKSSSRVGARTHTGNKPLHTTLALWRICKAVGVTLDIVRHIPPAHKDSLAQEVLQASLHEEVVVNVDGLARRISLPLLSPCPAWAQSLDRDVSFEGQGPCVCCRLLGTWTEKSLRTSRLLGLGPPTQSTANDEDHRTAVPTPHMYRGNQPSNVHGDSEDAGNHSMKTPPPCSETPARLDNAHNLTTGAIQTTQETVFAIIFLPRSCDAACLRQSTLYMRISVLFLSARLTNAPSALAHLCKPSAW